MAMWPYIIRKYRVTNQATSSVNDYGDGFSPQNLGCQNTGSQIQGDKNTVALSPPSSSISFVWASIHLTKSAVQGNRVTSRPSASTINDSLFVFSSRNRTSRKTKPTTF